MGVLVVDDNAQFRAVLCEVVAAAEGLTCIGEAASGEAALDAVAELSPRLVIMDKRMPGLGGIEASRQIAARHPGVAVFLVSVEPPRAETLAASGATAFLDKRHLSPRTLTELWREHAPD
jgi:two-component system invasion response regulator UvrY